MYFEGRIYGELNMFQKTSCFCNFPTTLRVGLLCSSHQVGLPCFFLQNLIQNLKCDEACFRDFDSKVIGSNGSSTLPNIIIQLVHELLNLHFMDPTCYTKISHVWFSYLLIKKKKKKKKETDKLSHLTKMDHSILIVGGSI